MFQPHCPFRPHQVTGWLGFEVQGTRGRGWLSPRSASRSSPA